MMKIKSKLVLSADPFPAFVCSQTGLKVIKEHKFHNERMWRFDYAILELMLAIEVEGGVFGNGRHVRGKGFVRDMEKYNMAAILGWKLIRLLPSELMTMKTINIITLFQIKSREVVNV